MKLGILTLYNADYGSYYQAVCLYNQLEKMGHECEIINILNRERRVAFNFFGSAVARFFPYIARRIANKIAPYNTFLMLRRDLKKYRISKNYFSMKRASKKYDCVVLGADELWSATNPYVKYIRTYYGYHITSPHISYATSGISIGTPNKKIMNNIRKDLNTFSSIGVRDEYTKEWVSKLTNKACNMVIDPTLLNPFFVEKKTINKEEKYILVYGETFSEESVKAIKDFAALVKCRIISVSWKHDWCEFVNAKSAEELQDLFAGATWCMTSTFHGTIFSILNQKNFMAFFTKHRGDKVYELLKSLKLENRLYKSGAIENKDIDYDAVNNILNDMRKDSLNYLKNALKEIED